MRTLSLLICGCFCSLLSAQNIHIYYDVSADSLYYVQNGKLTAEPSFQKGKPVKLHVVNYNDFLYDLSIDLEEKDVTVPSAGSGKMFQVGNKNLLSQLLSTAGQSEGSGSSVQNSVDWLANNEEGGSNFAAAEATVLAKTYSRLSTAYSSSLKNIIRKEQRISTQTTSIESDITIFAENQFMVAEIDQLKYNPQLRPEQIKRLSLEYLNRVFDDQEPEDLDLSEVIKKGNIRSKLNQKINKYKELVVELEKEILILELIKDSLISLPLPSPAEKQSLVLAYDRVKQTATNFEEQVTTMTKQASELKNWDIKDLMSVRYTYEELKNHPFAYTYTFTPKEDEVKLKITLSPNDSAKVKNLKKKEIAPIEFPTYGGIKVNASVGISFGGYFDRPQNYYSRDGQIRAEDGDAFLPIVTSFIHFYRQGQGSVSLGGSFGLGVAIGGETSGQTYFLGPSIILGKGQRVVISTGLMGGRIQRLGQDFEVGDNFDESNVPTRRVYEMGYFLGFSFNLG
ncbi:MAG: hypothetical protein KTR30_37520, partial [Saprospiraceae bacterium]|nr:hypothetical protein [Saprospiraceae bacterium]